MGKKLVSRTAKVLSETKKSRGKEAIAIAYEHIPRDPEEQKHGSIYAVVELEDTGGHAEQIAEKIIDVLHDEFYKDTTRTPLNAFENSLAKINEELAERSSEGQINWLGKLNAVLAVLTDSTLHLTQAGKAEAYLYRNDHTLHVTEDLAGDSINPIRTFINVASGDLTEKDRLLLVTPGIFYKLSKQELKKYATETSPKMAAEDLSQLLSGESGNSQPNAILIMEMVSPESFAIEPEPEKSTEAWVKDETSLLEPVAKETVQGAAKAFEVLGKAASGASTFISTKAFPAIKTSAQKVKEGFKKDPEASDIILESEERITEPANLDLDNESGILQSAVDDTREIRISERDTRPKFLSLERFDFSIAKKTKDSLLGKMKRVPVFSKSYLILGAVLILFLGGYLVYGGTIKKQQVAAANNLSQAQSRYEKAMAEISSGERALAIEDLGAAEKTANQVKEGKYKKTEAEKLLAQIVAAKNQALGIVKNTATLLADFGKSDLDGFYTDGTLVYALDYETGNIFSLDPKVGSVANLITNPGIDSKIKYGTIVPKRKMIFGYTETNEVYEFDLTAKKATKQKVSGEWEASVASDTYNTTVYLLSPSTNQIYKHLKTSSGYSRGTKYFSQEPAIANALDLAIDSDIYVLLSGGEIQKYTQGDVQPYAIKGLPAALTDAKDIFASADVKGQYISDGRSITQVDENQNFVSTFQSDTVKDIKGFFVNDETKTIYLLSEGKVFTINF